MGVALMGNHIEMRLKDLGKGNYLRRFVRERMNGHVLRGGAWEDSCSVLAASPRRMFCHN